MSAYSDYKCGAISYEDYKYYANVEAKRDRDSYYGVYDKADDDEEEEEEEEDDTV